MDKNHSFKITGDRMFNAKVIWLDPWTRVIIGIDAETFDPILKICEKHHQHISVTLKEYNDFVDSISSLLDGTYET